MINKSFLAGALTLVACGLPARASIVEYCSGTNPVCTTSSQAAFVTAVANDGYTYDGLTTFAASAPALSYTDSLSGILFEDFNGPHGGPLNDLTVNSGVLSTINGDDDIVLVIPATVLAVNLSVVVTKGVCGDYCAEGETTGFLGFINTDTNPTQWTVTISPLGNGGYTEIANFNAAIAPLTQSDTPEVGTILLIGTGLISMRWMKRVPRRLFHASSRVLAHA